MDMDFMVIDSTNMDTWWDFTKRNSPSDLSGFRINPRIDQKNGSVLAWTLVEIVWQEWFNFLFHETGNNLKNRWIYVWIKLRIGG